MMVCRRLLTFLFLIGLNSIIYGGLGNESCPTDNVSILKVDFGNIEAMHQWLLKKGFIDSNVDKEKVEAFFAKIKELFVNSEGKYIKITELDVSKIVERVSCCEIRCYLSYDGSKLFLSGKSEMLIYKNKNDLLNENCKEITTYTQQLDIITKRNIDGSKFSDDVRLLVIDLGKSKDTESILCDCKKWKHVSVYGDGELLVKS